MKNFFSTSLLLIISLTCFSQKVRIYYNEDWEITNKDSAKFFRIAEYKDRIYNGPVKDYYITGEIQMTGTYEDWLRNGKFTWYYKNGKKMCQGYYEDDSFTMETGWDSLGHLLVENGHGDFIWYNSYYNTKSSEGRYEYGHKVGLWIDYNYKGLKEQETNYTDDKVINLWDAKGKKLLDEYGNGTVTRYYLNGRVKFKGEYKYGKRNGNWIWYHENGDVDEKGSYYKGSQIGIWSYYYGRNRLRKKCKFNDYGALDGSVIWWHPNGKVKTKGYYRDGRSVGEWIWYDDKGVETSKEDYGNGY